MRLYIDDKPSTIAEVCQLLSIKQSSIPTHLKVKKFERLGVKGKIDPQSKKPIVPRGHGIPCSINVTGADGSVVKITYSENARPETRNGVNRLKHTPLTLMLPGFSLAVKDEEKVKFFYLFIHTYNKQSPLNFGKSNPNIVYEFLDTEFAAKEEQKKEDILYDAIAILKGLDDSAALQIAKGYELSPIINDLSTAEVRQLLREKMKKNPAQFIIDLEDNEVALKGIIQHAIDSGVIVVEENGLTRNWSVNGQRICQTQKGNNEIAALTAEIEADLDLFMPLIQGGVQAKDGASKLKKPEASKYFNQFKNIGDSEILAPALINSSGDTRTPGQIKMAEERIGKLRYWYSLDINSADMNANTRKALQNNEAEILAQFDKDKEEGVIPEDKPRPTFVVK